VRTLNRLVFAKEKYCNSVVEILQRLADGKTQRVALERDEHGVPHITSPNLEGVQFGLGFCHARDRGLQMLLVRSLGSGRACEQLLDTEEMLELDRYFRRWNLGGDASREETALSDQAKFGVEAYCQGVNLYFAENRLPWELRLLGYRFEPWTSADVFLTAKVAGLVTLASAQADIEQFIVECVQNGVNRERLEELFPGHLNGLDEALIRRVRLQERLVPESLKWASALPRMMASNNWAVAGGRTASGKPFLCNDPHLEVNRFPAIWYEAVLRWHSDSVARYAVGATFPGLPSVSIGRTQDLAWGITYAFMDCIDSWVEECRDGKYRRGDSWLPFVTRKEVIRRKKKPPLELLFYENDHGVLAGNASKPGYYLATRWSCAEGSSAEAFNSASGMLMAKTVAEGQALLGRVSNSSWNWVLADREGNIGYQMSGKMPVRREGVSGLVPLPGWDPTNDWQGFHPPEDLPRAFNPPRGFIATANQDLNDLGRAHPINVCMAGYRAERISAVLAAQDSSGEAMTLETMRELQLDLYSVQAERFMKLIRPLLAEFKSANPESVTLLLDWDLSYRSDSKAAFLFEQFYLALVCEVFGKCEGAFGDTVLKRVLSQTCVFFDFYGNFDRVLLAEDSAWFGGKSRDELYSAALAAALAIPPKTYGSTRRIRMRHLIFGGKLPLWFGFDREIELRGNRATVYQGQIYRGAGREMSFAPSFQMMTDLARDEIQTMLPGGASDRRFSKWYANGLSDWLQARYKILRP